MNTRRWENETVPHPIIVSRCLSLLPPASSWLRVRQVRRRVLPPSFEFLLGTVKGRYVVISTLVALLVT